MPHEPHHLTPDPAALSARLDRLEQELRDVRSRVNTLFYSVLSVAIADLIGRALLP